MSETGATVAAAAAAGPVMTGAISADSEREWQELMRSGATAARVAALDAPTDPSWLHAGDAAESGGTNGLDRMARAARYAARTDEEATELGLVRSLFMHHERRRREARRGRQSGAAHTWDVERRLLKYAREQNFRGAAAVEWHWRIRCTVDVLLALRAECGMLTQPEDDGHVCSADSCEPRNIDTLCMALCARRPDDWHRVLAPDRRTPRALFGDAARDALVPELVVPEVYMCRMQRVHICEPGRCDRTRYDRDAEGLRCALTMNTSELYDGSVREDTGGRGDGEGGGTRRFADLRVQAASQSRVRRRLGAGDGLEDDEDGAYPALPDNDFGVTALRTHLRRRLGRLRDSVRAERHGRQFAPVIAGRRGSSGARIRHGAGGSSRTRTVARRVLLAALREAGASTRAGGGSGAVPGPTASAGVIARQRRLRDTLLTETSFRSAARGGATAAAPLLRTAALTSGTGPAAQMRRRLLDDLQQWCAREGHYVKRTNAFERVLNAMGAPPTGSAATATAAATTGTTTGTRAPAGHHAYLSFLLEPAMRRAIAAEWGHDWTPRHPERLRVLTHPDVPAARRDLFLEALRVTKSLCPGLYRLKIEIPDVIAACRARQRELQRYVNQCVEAGRVPNAWRVLQGPLAAFDPRHYRVDLTDWLPEAEALECVHVMLHLWDVCTAAALTNARRRYMSVRNHCTAVLYFMAEGLVIGGHTIIPVHPKFRQRGYLVPPNRVHHYGYRRTGFSNGVLALQERLAELLHTVPVAQIKARRVDGLY